MPTTPLPRLVLLASSSRPQRILTALGARFHSVIAPVDIEIAPGESAKAYAMRVAKRMASTPLRPDDLLLASFSIVVVDCEVLTRPTDPADAQRMLTLLQGRDHIVWTALALARHNPARDTTATESVTVTLGAMSSDEIDWYLSTGEPLEEVGAYSPQGSGSIFVSAISGNYTTLLGSPLPTIRRLFGELDLDFRDYLDPSRQPGLTDTHIL